MLVVDDRAGAIDLARFTALTGLTLCSSGRNDLGFLVNAARDLVIQAGGVGQILDLRGLENCMKLDNLEILESCIESLAPLRGLQDLRRCLLIGAGESIQPEPPDFSAVSALNNLQDRGRRFGIA
ncbi:hypothetical protein [Streptomyces niveus]|uniref:hypothetical protein n=1 Tax=Streptomyces niveus TaxID=193462 RepID=UPI0034294ACD